MQCGEVTRILASTYVFRELLQLVAEMHLPQGCIAAGMVRNAVWDVLHGSAPCIHVGSDVDVIYFDAERRGRKYDEEIEDALRAQRPEIAWQVRNQARMHERNGDPPYASARDALRYFPETATAISARYERGTIAVDAPLGVADLFGLLVRPTPSFAGKAEIYRARIASKDWAARWPRLRFVDPWAVASAS